MVTKDYCLKKNDIESRVSLNISKVEAVLVLFVLCYRESVSLVQLTYGSDNNE